MASAATAGDRLVARPGQPHTLTTSAGASASPCDFSVTLRQAVSADVFIGGQQAAIANGSAEYGGSHPQLDPMSASGSWQPLLGSQATVSAGSATVTINGQPAVRGGDPASCCGSFNAQVEASGAAEVYIGD